MRHQINFFEFLPVRCNNLIAGITAVIGIIGGVLFITKTTKYYICKITDKRKRLPNEYEDVCNVCCLDIDHTDDETFVKCAICKQRICRRLKCASWLPESSQWKCELCKKSEESLAQTSSWVAEQISFHQEKCINPVRARSEIYIPISDYNDSSMHLESASQIDVNSTMISAEQKLKIRQYVEEILAEIFGGNLDTIAINQLSKSENYLNLFYKYHSKLSNILINLEKGLTFNAFKLGDLTDLKITKNTTCDNKYVTLDKDSPDLSAVSEARLRQMIQKIIAETINLPLLSSFNAESEIAHDTSAKRPSRNGYYQRHRTERYFEPKIYQDLLATAVLNKIVDTKLNRDQDKNLNTEEKSGENMKVDIGQADLDLENNLNIENLSTTSGSSVEPRSDFSYSDVDHILNANEEKSFELLHNIEQDDSAVSDYLPSHRVSLPDLMAVPTESEDDYLSVTSSAIEDGTWEKNWLFRKKKHHLSGSATISSVGMLVPDPTEDIRAQIGDKTADEVSDLSELGSDTDDSLDILQTKLDPINYRLINKHLIGGDNDKMVLDELIERSNIASKTLPTKREPLVIHANTLNEHVENASTEDETANNSVNQQKTDLHVDNCDNTKSKSPPIDLKDTYGCSVEADDDFSEADGCTGFSTIEVEERSPRTPSVVEMLAAMALGPMLAVPGVDQLPALTISELNALNDLKDLALAQIQSHSLDLVPHNLEVIPEETGDVMHLTESEPDFCSKDLLITSIQIGAEHREPLEHVFKPETSDNVNNALNIEIKTNSFSINSSNESTVSETLTHAALDNLNTKIIPFDCTTSVSQSSHEGIEKQDQHDLSRNYKAASTCIDIEKQILKPSNVRINQDFIKNNSNCQKITKPIDEKNDEQTFAMECEKYMGKLIIGKEHEHISEPISSVGRPEFKKQTNDLRTEIDIQIKNIIPQEPEINFQKGDESTTKPIYNEDAESPLLEDQVQVLQTTTASLIEDTEPKDYKTNSQNKVIQCPEIIENEFQNQKENIQREETTVLNTITEHFKDDGIIFSDNEQNIENKGNKFKLWSNGCDELMKSQQQNADMESLPLNNEVIDLSNNNNLQINKIVPQNTATSIKYIRESELILSQEQADEFQETNIEILIRNYRVNELQSITHSQSNEIEPQNTNADIKRVEKYKLLLPDNRNVENKQTKNQSNKIEPQTTDENIKKDALKLSDNQNIESMESQVNVNKFTKAISDCPISKYEDTKFKDIINSQSNKIVPTNIDPNIGKNERIENTESHQETIIECSIPNNTATKLQSIINTESNEVPQNTDLNIHDVAKTKLKLSDNGNIEDTKLQYQVNEFQKNVVECAISNNKANELQNTVYFESNQNTPLNTAANIDNDDRIIKKTESQNTFVECLTSNDEVVKLQSYINSESNEIVSESICISPKNVEKTELKLLENVDVESVKVQDQVNRFHEPIVECLTSNNKVAELHITINFESTETVSQNTDTNNDNVQENEFHKLIINCPILKNEDSKLQSTINSQSNMNMLKNADANIHNDEKTKMKLSNLCGNTENTESKDPYIEFQKTIDQCRVSNVEVSEPQSTINVESNQNVPKYSTTNFDNDEKAELKLSDHIHIENTESKDQVYESFKTIFEHQVFNAEVTELKTIKIVPQNTDINIEEKVDDKLLDDKNVERTESKDQEKKMLKTIVECSLTNNKVTKSLNTISSESFEIEPLNTDKHFANVTKANLKLSNDDNIEGTDSQDQENMSKGSIVDYSPSNDEVAELQTAINTENKRNLSQNADATIDSFEKFELLVLDDRNIKNGELQDQVTKFQGCPVSSNEATEFQNTTFSEFNETVLQNTDRNTANVEKVEIKLSDNVITESTESQDEVNELYEFIVDFSILNNDINSESNRNIDKDETKYSDAGNIKKPKSQDLLYESQEANGEDSKLQSTINSQLNENVPKNIATIIDNDKQFKLKLSVDGNIANTKAQDQIKDFYSNVEVFKLQRTNSFGSKKNLLDNIVTDIANDKKAELKLSDDKSFENMEFQDQVDESRKNIVECLISTDEANKSQSTNNPDSMANVPENIAKYEEAELKLSDDRNVQNKEFLDQIDETIVDRLTAADEATNNSDSKANAQVNTVTDIVNDEKAELKLSDEKKVENMEFQNQVYECQKTIVKFLISSDEANKLQSTTNPDLKANVPENIVNDEKSELKLCDGRNVQNKEFQHQIDESQETIVECLISADEVIKLQNSNNSDSKTNVTENIAYDEKTDLKLSDDKNVQNKEFHDQVDDSQETIVECLISADEATNNSDSKANTHVDTVTDTVNNQKAELKLCDDKNVKIMEFQNQLVDCRKTTVECLTSTDEASKLQNTYCSDSKANAQVDTVTDIVNDEKAELNLADEKKVENMEFQNQVDECQKTIVKFLISTDEANQLQSTTNPDLKANVPENIVNDEKSDDGNVQNKEFQDQIDESQEAIVECLISADEVIKLQNSNNSDSKTNMTENIAYDEKTDLQLSDDKNVQNNEFHDQVDDSQETIVECIISADEATNNSDSKANAHVHTVTDIVNDEKAELNLSGDKNVEIMEFQNQLVECQKAIVECLTATDEASKLQSTNNSESKANVPDDRVTDIVNNEKAELKLSDDKNVKKKEFQDQIDESQEIIAKCIISADEATKLQSTNNSNSKANAPDNTATDTVNDEKAELKFSDVKNVQNKEFHDQVDDSQETIVECLISADVATNNSDSKTNAQVNTVADIVNDEKAELNLSGDKNVENIEFQTQVDESQATIAKCLISPDEANKLQSTNNPDSKANVPENIVNDDKSELKLSDDRNVQNKEFQDQIDEPQETIVKCPISPDEANKLQSTNNPDSKANVPENIVNDEKSELKLSDDRNVQNKEFQDQIDESQETIVKCLISPDEATINSDSKANAQVNTVTDIVNDEKAELNLSGDKNVEIMEFQNQLVECQKTIVECLTATEEASKLRSTNNSDLKANVPDDRVTYIVNDEKAELKFTDVKNVQNKEFHDQVDDSQETIVECLISANEATNNSDSKTNAQVNKVTDIVNDEKAELDLSGDKNVENIEFQNQVDESQTTIVKCLISPDVANKLQSTNNPDSKANVPENIVYDEKTELKLSDDKNVQNKEFHDQVDDSQETIVECLILADEATNNSDLKANAQVNTVTDVVNDEKTELNFSGDKNVENMEFQNQVNECQKTIVKCLISIDEANNLQSTNNPDSKASVPENIVNDEKIDFKLSDYKNVQNKEFHDQVDDSQETIVECLISADEATINSDSKANAQVNTVTDIVNDEKAELNLSGDKNVEIMEFQNQLVECQKTIVECLTATDEASKLQSTNNSDSKANVPDDRVTNIVNDEKAELKFSDVKNVQNKEFHDQVDDSQETIVECLISADEDTNNSDSKTNAKVNTVTDIVNDEKAELNLSGDKNVENIEFQNQVDESQTTIFKCLISPDEANKLQNINNSDSKTNVMENIVYDEKTDLKLSDDKNVQNKQFHDQVDDSQETIVECLISADEATNNSDSKTNAQVNTVTDIVNDEKAELNLSGDKNVENIEFQNQVDESQTTMSKCLISPDEANKLQSTNNPDSKANVPENIVYDEKTELKLSDDKNVQNKEFHDQVDDSQETIVECLISADEATINSDSKANAQVNTVTDIVNDEKAELNLSGDKNVEIMEFQNQLVECQKTIVECLTATDETSKLQSTNNSDSKANVPDDRVTNIVNDEKAELKFSDVKNVQNKEFHDQVDDSQETIVECLISADEDTNNSDSKTNAKVNTVTDIVNDEKAELNLSGDKNVENIEFQNQVDESQTTIFKCLISPDEANKLQSTNNPESKANVPENIVDDDKSELKLSDDRYIQNQEFQDQIDEPQETIVKCLISPDEANKLQNTNNPDSKANVPENIVNDEKTDLKLSDYKNVQNKEFHDQVNETQETIVECLISADEATNNSDPKANAQVNTVTDIVNDEKAESNLSGDKNVENIEFQNQVDECRKTIVKCLISPDEANKLQSTNNPDSKANVPEDIVNDDKSELKLSDDRNVQNKEFQDQIDESQETIVECLISADEVIKLQNTNNFESKANVPKNTVTDTINDEKVERKFFDDKNFENIEFHDQNVESLKTIVECQTATDEASKLQSTKLSGSKVNVKDNTIANIVNYDKSKLKLFDERNIENKEFQDPIDESQETIVECPISADEVTKLQSTNNSDSKANAPENIVTDIANDENANLKLSSDKNVEIMEFRNQVDEFQKTVVECLILTDETIKLQSTYNFKSKTNFPENIVTDEKAELKLSDVKNVQNKEFQDQIDESQEVIVECLISNDEANKLKCTNNSDSKSNSPDNTVTNIVNDEKAQLKLSGDKNVQNIEFQNQIDQSQKTIVECLTSADEVTTLRRTNNAITNNDVTESQTTKLQNSDAKVVKAELKFLDDANSESTESKYKVTELHKSIVEYSVSDNKVHCESTGIVLAITGTNIDNDGKVELKFSAENIENTESQDQVNACQLTVTELPISNDEVTQLQSTTNIDNDKKLKLKSSVDGIIKNTEFSDQVSKFKDTIVEYAFISNEVTKFQCAMNFQSFEDVPQYKDTNIGNIEKAELKFTDNQKVGSVESHNKVNEVTNVIVTQNSDTYNKSFGKADLKLFELDMFKNRESKDRVNELQNTFVEYQISNSEITEFQCNMSSQSYDILSQKTDLKLLNGRNVKRKESIDQLTELQETEHNNSNLLTTQTADLHYTTAYPTKTNFDFSITEINTSPEETSGSVFKDQFSIDDTPTLTRQCTVVEFKDTNNFVEENIKPTVLNPSNSFANTNKGSIAEREYKKWYNAVEMPNNPYAPEALKRRISGSQERFIDLPNISPIKELNILKSLKTDTLDSDETQKRENDYKRYSRDYYINSSSTSSQSTPVKELSAHKDTNEHTNCILSYENDETNFDLYKATPVHVVQENNSSTVDSSQLLKLSDLEGGGITTTVTESDDSDTLKIKNLHAHETAEKCKVEIRPNEMCKKIENCANNSILSRGSTPTAFKFLQPKRKLLKPNQVLSVDEDETHVVTTTHDKPVIEEEVAKALPSVKALARAFLMTTNTTQPEKLWLRKARTLSQSGKKIQPNAEEDVTITSDLSSLETDSSSVQREAKVTSTGCPDSLPIRQGDFKSNIAFFENLKNK